MRRRVLSSWLLALCGGWAIGCSTRAEPPPETGTQVAPPLGAAPPTARRDGGVSTDAAPALDANVLDGASPDGASPDAAIVHATPDAGAASCDPNASWVMDEELPISTNGLDERFGSISADELTLAWTTEQGHVRTSDRASTALEFQVRRSVFGSYALDRAALSADGLRLAIVASDRRSIVEATRASRADPFDPPSEGAFAVIDQQAASSITADEGFADPVFSPDDRTLLYTRFGAGRVVTVFRSERLFAGDPWPIGAPLAIAELDAQGALGRHPSGFSSDGRVLFFWDDVTQTARAGALSAQSDTFVTVATLGARRGAMPNAACDRLYFSAPAKMSLGLFTATRL